MCVCMRFLCQRDCLCSLAARVCGSGRNVRLTVLFLRLKASLERGSFKQTCWSEGSVKRPILFVSRSSMAIQYPRQKCNQGYVCPLGLLVRDVVILYRAERAAFARDGLIIYIDTDDAVSQLPGGLSDMLHTAELQTASLRL